VDDTEGSEAGGRGRGGSGNGGKGKEEDGETEGQIKVCLVIASHLFFGPSKLTRITDRLSGTTRGYTVQVSRVS
jgi:hypothetical protein